MGRYYILRDGEIVEEPDYQVWSSWYEESYEQVRRIAHTGTDHAAISTDFLAMDMSLSHDEPPMIFETKVTGGWLDGERERFASLDEARKGHESWVAKVRAAEEENQLPPPGAGW